MSKKLLPLMVIGLLSISLAACSKKAEEPAKTETPVATETAAPAAPTPDQLPFDFPAVETDAKAGEFVLTPGRVSLDNALKGKPGDLVTLIYYNATMVEPGEKTSKVKELLDETVIPNALIVPLKAGASAKAGDIVLTWNQSGSGMIRALVKEGGTAPKVAYLGEYGGEGTLQANSFVVLSDGWNAGVSVACKDKYGDYKHSTLVNMSGGKILTNGWGSSMEVLQKSDCVTVPVKVDVKAGDTIYVAPYSTFSAATVKSVDAATGMVQAEYDFAGEKKTEPFAFGDILMSMPK